MKQLDLGYLGYRLEFLAIMARGSVEEDVDAMVVHMVCCWRMAGMSNGMDILTTVFVMMNDYQECGRQTKSLLALGVTTIQLQKELSRPFVSVLLKRGWAEEARACIHTNEGALHSVPMHLRRGEKEWEP